MLSSVTERLASALVEQYRIEEEIGRGTSATVYLAHNLRHDRKLARRHHDRPEHEGRAGRIHSAGSMCRE
jgi:hypothetical protein